MTDIEVVFMFVPFMFVCLVFYVGMLTERCRWQRRTKKDPTLLEDSDWIKTGIHPINNSKGGWNPRPTQRRPPPPKGQG